MIIVPSCYDIQLLSYLTWPLHTFLASKPLTQLAISRYPSDIAIEADYLAFCHRDPIISSSIFARARQLVTNCRRARPSFANQHAHAQFAVLDLHRMRTFGALARFRSPSSWNLVLTMTAAAP
eukprot:6213912-Pleurochrysis_carterae.AAC.2